MIVPCIVCLMRLHPICDYVTASQVADNPEDTPSGDVATVPAAVPTAVQVDPEVDATCCPSLLLTLLTHSPVVLKHTPVVLTHSPVDCQHASWITVVCM